MSNDTTTKTRPTHRIYAVTKQGDKKPFYQRIGAAWTHPDGKGLNLSLDYLPLNDAKIVLRVISEEPVAAPASQDEAA